MATSNPKPQPKPTKSPPSTSSSSSLSSHLAMVELKTRILTSLSKLSDRDTHQIAADDLDKIIKTLPSDGVPMLLNCLTHDPIPSDPATATSVYRRESLRLIPLLASSHPDPLSAHLPKIMAHIVKRLKDPASDSSVRDACRDVAGSLAGIYLKGQQSDGGSSSPVVGLFVRPLLEAMGEQSKAVQAGAAGCLAKVVECGGEGGSPAGTAAMFQRLCPRICKLVGGQGVIAKGALLSVFSSLSQVGAISPQSMPTVLQSIRECLDNSDWATRKAAADTLSVLASHSCQLVIEGSASTIAALEACRFDKVKPVRDSMMEALQQWKKIAGKGGDEISQNPKEDKNCESIDTEGNMEKSASYGKKSESMKELSAGASPSGVDTITKEKGRHIPEKGSLLLKKKAPFSDKEMNPDFFQKLETRCLDDLPVEVVVPRKCVQSSHSQGEEQDLTVGDVVDPSNHNGSLVRESSETQVRTNIKYINTDKRLGSSNKLHDADDFAPDKEQRGFRSKDSKSTASDVDDRAEPIQRDLSTTRISFARSDGHTDGSFMNGRGNWLVIQRQLSQLERQQANLMNMLQDFMEGSHDSMITLESRVRGLERVVEEMARDLSLSSGRRSSSAMLGYEGSPGRTSSKYKGLHDYTSSKFGRGRDPPWRSDSDQWDSYGHHGPRNGLPSSRRVLGSASIDSRSSRTEHEGDQPGSRRAWDKGDKGQGPFRLGEGPSARSVWQASKDEATLEAIRVAGEDNGTFQISTRIAVPELDGEALTDDNSAHDKGPLWASWTRAMNSLHVGDFDSAYAEVLSSGDDMLLVKLMERSGPIVDQLSCEIATDVLNAVGQFLPEQSLFDIALTWIQQLTELIMENGAEFIDIPLEVKKEILSGLHEASGIDLPEDWEGATADQLLMQLASSWEFNIQKLIK